MKENFRVDQEIERHDFFKNLEDDKVSTKRGKIFDILWSNLNILCVGKENIKFDQNDTLNLDNIPKLIS